MREIIAFDKDLFLAINGKHVEWLDPVMLFFSSYTGWTAIAIVILLYAIYKGKRWRWSVAIFTVLTVLTTSMLNNAIKMIVMRPRPIHEEALADIIHAIESYDASYSFFSAHSANSFALAIFAAFSVRQWPFTVFALFWAAMVAYSRIYVGKHYPLDVVIGILFGVLMAYSWRWLFNYYKRLKSN